MSAPNKIGSVKAKAGPGWGPMPHKRFKGKLQITVKAKWDAFHNHYKVVHVDNSIEWTAGDIVSKDDVAEMLKRMPPIKVSTN